jgi:tRNA(fMet)-specific endonuclease VapC
MRRYLLDTGIAGHFANDRYGVRTRVQDEIRRGNKIGTCVPVLGELYYGVENSETRERNLRLLLIALNHLRIWPYTNEAAEGFGRIRAELRRLGRPMQIVDMQLAAIALTLGNCTVVTTDSDLAAVPGLRVENWAEPAPESS